MADFDRPDGVKKGSIVVVTKRTGGVPVTGRLMRVGRTYENKIHVCYVSDARDVDPSSGKWNVDKHPNCNGLALSDGCFRIIS